MGYGFLCGQRKEDVYSTREDREALYLAGCGWGERGLRMKGCRYREDNSIAYQMNNNVSNKLRTENVQTIKIDFRHSLQKCEIAILLFCVEIYYGVASENSRMASTP